jgi:hypothetical protein
VIEAGEMHDSPQPPVPRGSSDRWDEVLAELEREVAAGERLLDRVRRGLAPLDEFPSAWSAPDGLGPLSGEVLVRAHALLARQTAVTRSFSEALEGVRASQRRTVRQLPGEYPGSGGSSSAYVDITT